jgi:hypothetical protein
MEISGEVLLKRCFGKGYKRLKSFHMRLYLLDDNGNVLETRGLATSRRSDTQQIRTFQQAVALPLRTTSMAFGYSGVVVGRRQGDSPFWYVPTGF